MKLLLPLALGSIALAMSLPSCVGGLTPHQSMYAAYGSYAAALHSAADYAEQPSADRAIVSRLNAINKSAGVKAAVTYGRAYTACQGTNTAVVSGIDCAAFDFRASTASGYASTLRITVRQLLTR